MKSLSFLAAASEVPDRTALVANGQPYRYADLAPAVRRACSFLDDRDAHRVALVAENGLDTLVWLYALMERGTSAVLVHPRLTEKERQRVLAASAPDLVLCESHLSAWRQADLIRAELPTPPHERPLAVVFTSGTTGHPKGAVLSRRAFLAAAQASAENLGWQEEDRWLLCMPLAHVGGLSIVVRCLVARRTVVLAEPKDIATSLGRDQVTLASLVPTQLARLVDAGTKPPPGLRALLLGGAPATTALLARALDQGWPVLATYGLTEACSQVTTQRYGQVKSGGVGVPVSGMEIRLVDEEIQVRGPSLFDAYLGHPNHEGWFATGDLGRLDEDGHLHILARRTDLIVTGGENVYPSEVESVLERVPGVRAACVFGVEDETWGQVVCAALVAERLPIDFDLRACLAAELARHKHPRRIAYPPSLCYTPTGKLDRSATRKACQAALVPL